jgi:hypothetical protein
VKLLQPITLLLLLVNTHISASYCCMLVVHMCILQLFTEQGRLEHLLTETFLIAPESVSTVEAELQRNTRHSATVELSVSVKGGGTVYLGTHADAHLKNPAHYGAFMSLVSSHRTVNCLGIAASAARKLLLVWPRHCSARTASCCDCSHTAMTATPHNMSCADPCAAASFAFQ